MCNSLSPLQESQITQPGYSIITFINWIIMFTRRTRFDLVFHFLLLDVGYLRGRSPQIFCRSGSWFQLQSFSWSSFGILFHHKIFISKVLLANSWTLCWLPVLYPNLVHPQLPQLGSFFFFWKWERLHLLMAVSWRSTLASNNATHRHLDLKKLKEEKNGERKNELKWQLHGPKETTQTSPGAAKNP